MIKAVIPMAGAGKRFTEQGYLQPKFLIDFEGKPILEHSLAGLPLDLFDELYFVALDAHVRQYDLQGVLDSMVRGRRFRLVTVPQVTRGQAETVLACRKQIDGPDDLIVFNIDTYYSSAAQRDYLAGRLDKYDGFLGAAHLGGDRWSFAHTDDHGFVACTAEKVRISDNALTGLYHFSRGSDFVEVANSALRSMKGDAECYIAPLYNALIARGKKFVLDRVDAFVPLGTPADLVLAKGLIK